jgi:ATP citrate (pro-S)-lyase
MPGLKLSEYQIKTLFGLKPDYLNKSKLDLLINNDKYVGKVDNGIKHRMIRNLVKINIDREECYKWILERNTDDNYIVETPINFDTEYYVSIRPYNYMYNEILFSNNGGINLEDPENECSKYLMNIYEFEPNNICDIEGELLIFLGELYNFYLEYHFTFIETNPIVMDTNTNKYVPLDMTGTIDTDAIYLFTNKDRELIELPYISEKIKTPEEIAIQKLDERTGGSLKFTLLNPNGTVWTLIAGGGASVVYTDAIIYRGYINDLANYGEYSGDPQEDLVEAYCNEIFKCMNRVLEPKTLFIGGAIANFTDIYSTFSGIIKSIHNNYNVLKDTKVYIRRGGPNDIKALSAIKSVLDSYNIFNEVYNSDTNITQIVEFGLPKKEMNLTSIHNDDFDIDLLGDGINKFNTINKHTKCAILGYHKNAIQRMLDFDYMCGHLDRTVLCIIEERQSKDTMESFFYGNNSVLIPVYTSLESAIENHNPELIINFLSFRSAYESTLKILDTIVQTIVIIAEGIPELFTRKLKDKANKLNKTIIGPATVGGIFGGEFRIANTGGSNENLLKCKLYNKGNVGFVTRSGGLLNELCSIISKNTSGVHSGISIGGDRYPCTGMLEIALNYENNPEIDLIICLGELGGVEEIKLGQAKKSGLIKKPIIAYCIGISSDLLGNEVQFGHAGSSATNKYENAIFKNNYMRKCGIIVPDCFEDIEITIKSNFVYRDIQTKQPNIISSTRKMPIIYSSISDETGDQLTYNKIPISELLNSGIGKTIGHLWLKRDIPEWFSKYIELILIVTADHGAMVSGAMNTIVSSRANRDLVSALCSGLLTIGDRFGGALNDSAKQFKIAVEKYTPQEFINVMKKDNVLIMGIGHKVKTVENPDIRVQLLKKYVQENFPSYEHVKYALDVEQITTQKKNNLILNVDGFVANSLLDAFSIIMSKSELDEIIKNDFINAFFILGRTIGFIGHWYDQKRLKQGLFRLNESLVGYI